MALKRDQILEAKDHRFEIVKVPEWAVDGDDEVIVSSMNGTARDEWEQSVFDDAGNVNKANHRARLLSFTITDENGNRIFTEDDIVRLGLRDWAALERCVRAAQRLNLISIDAVEQAQGN